MKTLKPVGFTSEQRVLWMALFAQGINGRRGLPYVLVGPPGAAKTSNVGQLCEAAGLRYEAVLGSIRSPVDFLGVPFLQKMPLDDHTQHLSPDGDSHFAYTHYAPSGFAVRAAAAKRSCILLDELNTCGMSVQAALLRVMFEGVVGELPLPKETRLLCAMNPVSMSAGGRELAMPLINRMGVIDWPAPDVEGFTRFLLSGGQFEAQPRSAAVEEAQVDELWAQAWPQALGAVTGFLRRMPDELLKLPKQAGVPWQSPRSWELATRAIAGSLVYGLTKDEEALAVAAFVGTPAFSQFYSWRKNADLPDPIDLLEGRAHFEHVASRLDRTAAVLSSCSAIVTPEKCENRKARLERLWQLIRDIPDDALDVAMPAAAELCRLKLMVGSQTAYKALTRMEPMMAAAGLIQ